MRLILLAALAAITIYGQDAKVAPKADAPPVPTATPNERLLTTEESLKLENSVLRIKMAEKDFRIEEYKAEVAPAAAVQEEVMQIACKSVGVPADKIHQECGIAGFGPDGKPVNGPDGKPMPRKVWWAKPAAVSAADAMKQNGLVVIPEKK